MCVDNNHEGMRECKKHGWQDLNDCYYYRVLCMNCNKSRGSYGYCPHEKENNELSNNSYDGNFRQKASNY